MVPLLMMWFIAVIMPPSALDQLSERLWNDLVCGVVRMFSWL